MYIIAGIIAFVFILGSLGLGFKFGVKAGTDQDLAAQIQKMQKSKERQGLIMSRLNAQVNDLRAQLNTLKQINKIQEMFLSGVCNLQDGKRYIDRDVALDIEERYGKVNGYVKVKDLPSFKLYMTDSKPISDFVEELYAPAVSVIDAEASEKARLELEEDYDLDEEEGVEKQ